MHQMNQQIPQTENKQEKRETTDTGRNTNMSQQTDKIKTLSNANEEETEIDLLELFYYLKAKLVWLISFFVIGAVIAGLITYFLITPKYTATSKLHCQPVRFKSWYFPDRRLCRTFIDQTDL